jgi:hypothetical protein
VAAGNVLEFAVPIEGDGTEIVFTIIVSHGSQREHIPLQPIRLARPDASFPARHWSA